jgi:putative membrane protein
LHRLALIFGVAAVAAVCISAGQAAGRSSPSAQDANYLQTSISGDRFEIIGGKIALSKSGNSAVRALARRLIHDHSQSLRDAVKLAKQLNVKVPGAPTASEVWELNMVRSLSPSFFDASYSTLEIKDHQQDIEETTFELMHGGSSQVKADAKKDLPMLKMHLSLSKAAARSLGISL